MQVPLGQTCLRLRAVCQNARHTESLLFLRECGVRLLVVVVVLMMLPLLTDAVGRSLISVYYVVPT